MRRPNFFVMGMAKAAIGQRLRADLTGHFAEAIAHRKALIGHVLTGGQA